MGVLAPSRLILTGVCVLDVVMQRKLLLICFSNRYWPEGLVLASVADELDGLMIAEEASQRQCE